MQAIVILGMYRSGTSALTRALGLLGASMGPAESLGKFWENRYMRRQNDRLLAAFGGSWPAPPPLPDGWAHSSEARAVEPGGREALREFEGASVFVWKDPRTCLTLPFWIGLLDQPPVIVFTHRNPLETAGSQQRRDGFGTGHSFALWERYNRDALRHSQELRTFVLHYAELVDDPVTVMRSLVDALQGWGIELPGSPEDTDMELSPERRHHHAGSRTLLDEPASTPSQRELLSTLDALHGAYEPGTLPRSLPEPSPLSTELLATCHELREARADARAVTEELRQLRGSRRRLLRQLVTSSSGDGRPAGR